MEMTLTYQCIRLWRRGWDSNPRYPCEHNGFRDRPVRPLRHLSTWSLASGGADHTPGLGDGAIGIGMAVGKWADGRGSEAGEMLFHLHCLLAHQLAGGEPVDVGQGLHRPLADRKSKRLNSSH